MRAALAMCVLFSLAACAHAKKPQIDVGDCVRFNLPGPNVQHYVVVERHDAKATLARIEGKGMATDKYNPTHLDEIPADPRFLVKEACP